MIKRYAINEIATMGSWNSDTEIAEAVAVAVYQKRECLHSNDKYIQIGTIDATRRAPGPIPKTARPITSAKAQCATARLCDITFIYQITDVNFHSPDIEKAMAWAARSP